MRAPPEDAVRSPELRRGGRRMVVTATKRAGWWIPIGLAGSLLWVGAKVARAVGGARRDRRRLLAVRQHRDPQVVRRDPRAGGVRGARCGGPLVLRVLRRAPHGARAALAAVRAPAAASLRLSRPRPDREPDGAREPRPAPDQPARRVRPGLRGERRHGHRDPRRAVHPQRQAHAARRSSASRCSPSAQPGSRSSSIPSPPVCRNDSPRFRRSSKKASPGIRVVKGFGAEQVEKELLDGRAEQVRVEAVALGKLRATFNPMLDLLPDGRARHGAVRRRQGRDRRIAHGRRSRRVQRAPPPARLPAAHDVVRGGADCARIGVGGAGAGSDGHRARDRRRRVGATAPAGARCGLVLRRVASRTTEPATCCGDFDLEIAGGESVALVGPTGAARARWRA